MKKLLCMLLCVSFLFTTGCGLFKSDEEKYQDLTTKFEQEFKTAPDKTTKQKLAEEYKNAVPEKYKDKATAFSNNLFFFSSPDKKNKTNSSPSEIGHY